MPSRGRRHRGPGWDRSETRQAFLIAETSNSRVTLSLTSTPPALVLTLGTVGKHVASIFGKLGLPPSESDNRRVLAVMRYLGS